MTIFRVVGAAFDKMDGDGSPSVLSEALSAAAKFLASETVTVDSLIGHVETAPADDATTRRTRQAFAKWDGDEETAWAEGTGHGTLERRARVIELLGVSTPQAEKLAKLCPPHIVEDFGHSISVPFTKWWDRQAQEDQGFYWPAYRKLLLDKQGWPPTNVENLSRASAQVVERLGDPYGRRPDSHQARGLVVGYVQSGKTANFTGVIARAVDAGYRLIIVLTGMTTVLREQTQRRLDTQLVGLELLMGPGGAGFEYAGAPDLDDFVRYGTLPSEQGAVDWERLTHFSSDYESLGTGIAALHFKKTVSSEPLNSRTNLAHLSARLVVTTKNKTRLDNLVNDLRHVQTSHKLNDLPALIIDDESDQASINTRKLPVGRQKQERTAINKAIVDLLELLPRAQYVGYTATPTASVFVDPNDEAGIFPRDFIIGLDRPAGYVGASDFHDFDFPPAGPPSNEESFVRAVKGVDTLPGNLQAALDSYILSGALKLFRAEAGIDVSTRHHTMLVHTSHLTNEHKEMRDGVEHLIVDSGYSDGRANSRLEALLGNDFGRISKSRAPEMPIPSSYEELFPFVGKCLSKLVTGGRPALVVNGDKEFKDEQPDFDQQSVWKVIVGGTKLSRGFTVEGLTVSYYRRSAKAADTLMQMGRWFGFRHGYRDLVRLYIGTAEPLGGKRSKKTINLYEAFGAVCQDEAEFREELRRYALPPSGQPPLTPSMVPPLVRQRFPELMPTAANKRFNARIISENYGGKAIAPTLAPLDSQDKRRKANLRITKTLFQSGTPLGSMTLGGADSFPALVFELTADAMKEFTEGYQFSRSGILDRQIDFFAGNIGDPEIDRWIVAWPQLVGDPNGSWNITPSAVVTMIQRFRDSETGRFGVYTEPNHPIAAKLLAGVEFDSTATDDTKSLIAPRTAAALFYAVLPKGFTEDKPHIGFSLYPPRNRIAQNQTQWGYFDPEKKDVAVVDI